ncbi:annulin-like isoform X2 [Ischnura elegans]|uniref:annulin-like isoform X2 n=1 Tax=Ischnura elegans TaxID=197161 RepID=UPI001ED87E3D|nr:annulin-like isoform X2 [Ischnura elegans]
MFSYVGNSVNNVYRRVWPPWRTRQPAAPPVSPSPAPPVRRHSRPLPRPPPAAISPVPVAASTAGAEVSADAEKSVLVVSGVDLLFSENGASHRTYEFDLMERAVAETAEPGGRISKGRLIVRRGQPFAINLKLSRPYNEEKDAISLVFTVADTEKPSYGQGTLIAVPVMAKGSMSDNELSHINMASGNHYPWKAEVDPKHISDSSVRIEVTPSADTMIGMWKLDIDTKFKSHGSGDAVSYSYPHPIYILFNPWCPRDSVYMGPNKEEELKEYVLCDTGLIWRGSHNRLRPCVWRYAQFEADILDCSLYLAFKIGKLNLAGRSDPVRITRALSAAVNSPDDNGALVGNWSGDFSGGTAPTKWVGSMKILQEYYRTKKPVKYGQCWIFGGVLTTVCRALGIPSRTITNYSSAHDTQSSLTVDYFLDGEGEIMDEMNNDSVWNFHVWNEVWMHRPDLAPTGGVGGVGEEVGHECDGWQVIDATPQELSDDVYRCGPASVSAVKRGEVLRPFDGQFVYAEVNADKVFWRYSGPTQPLKLLRKDIQGIGQFISTKAVGKYVREDITHNYKFPEKSAEERAAMLRALRQSESMFSRYYLNEDFNDLKFDFELRDDIVIGQPFSVVVVMKNNSRTKDHTVSVLLRVDTVLYTGKIKEGVRKEKTERLVKAGAVEEIRLDVSYEDYYSHLVDQCAFNIACMATVAETNFEYFAQDDFRVRKPDIKIKTEGELVQGKEFTATASLKNPLPIPLRKGQFIIEGQGLTHQLKIKMAQDIPPGGDAIASFNITPTFHGQKTIAAKFTSKELEDVDGFIVVKVAPPKAETNGSGAANST